MSSIVAPNNRVAALALTILDAGDPPNCTTVTAKNTPKSMTWAMFVSEPAAFSSVIARSHSGARKTKPGSCWNPENSQNDEAQVCPADTSESEQPQRNQAGSG